VALVYVAVCRLNGKRYVGMTSGTLSKRRGGHATRSRDLRRTEAFPSALRKYGVDSFDWHVVADGLSLDEAQLLEIQTITRMNTKAPAGYNLASGGRVHTWHPDSKAKASESRKGYVRTEASKEKQAASRRGKKLDPADVAKRAAAQTGSVRSPETRQKQSRARKEWHEKKRLANKNAPDLV
jgi:group I intron endonuclease